MQYGVRITTRTVETDYRKPDHERDHFSTQTIMCHDRRDADGMSAAINQHDGAVKYHDGPDVYKERHAEVVGILYVSSKNGGRKLELTMPEIEMIADAYTGRDTEMFGKAAE